MCEGTSETRNDIGSYEKIDYERQNRIYLIKLLAGITILLAAFLVLISFITGVLGFDLEGGTILGIAGIILIILITPVIFPTFRMWFSNYRKTGSIFFRNMVIGFGVLYCNCFFQAILPILMDRLDEAQIIIVFFSLMSILIIGMVVLFKCVMDLKGMKREGVMTHLATLQIVVSAEREVEDYQDGYSSRPFETDFGEYDSRAMKGFCIALLKRLMIWDFELGEDGVRIIFTPAPKGFRFPVFQKVKSYLYIPADGKTRVFVTSQDYEYLKLPLSYHLLCRRLVEKMRESYELFAAGDEAAALRVFKVVKDGKVNE